MTETLELMSRKCILISCGGLKLNLNTQVITTSAMSKITGKGSENGDEMTRLLATTTVNILMTSFGSLRNMVIFTGSSTTSTRTQKLPNEGKAIVIGVRSMASSLMINYGNLLRSSSHH